MLSRIETYPRDEERTAKINLPEITIMQTPGWSFERDIGEDPGDCVSGAEEWVGILCPTEPIICPKCHCMAASNGYDEPRPVLDVIGDHVISITLEKEKFICNNCNQGVIYHPSCIAGRESQTTRYQDWLARKCLTMSADKVAAMVGNHPKASTIKKIFAKWCEDRYEEYLAHLVPPAQLGVHFIDDNFIILTDLERGNVLDVFDHSAGLISLLHRLYRFAMSESVREVCSSLQIESLTHTRGVYQHSFYKAGLSQKQSTVISAALCTLHDVVVREIRDALNVAPGHLQKEILSVVSMPVYEVPNHRQYHTITAKLIRKEFLNLPPLISIEESLRNKLRLNILTKADYDDVLRKINLLIDSNCDIAEHLNTCIQSASKEIETGFAQPELQRQYQDLDNGIVEIVQKSQKCRFETLRARILFTLAPELTTHTDSVTHKFTYTHTGINVKNLSMSLSDFDA